MRMEPVDAENVKRLESRRFLGAGDGTRTRDPLFTRQVLYQLSYSGA